MRYRTWLSSFRYVVKTVARGDRHAFARVSLRSWLRRFGACFRDKLASGSLTRVPAGEYLPFLPCRLPTLRRQVCWVFCFGLFLSRAVTRSRYRFWISSDLGPFQYSLLGSPICFSRPAI